ncbi:polysaccharide deacetylase family protein [Akkermansiaceae bacterium]|nr:polysaccharide deacetylase family protein [Akkermansiaceae bacterium]
MKKKFYLSVDLEEWYHLLYFKKYTNFKGKDFFTLKINEFLTFLKKRQIKATFFVLAELAEKHPSIIKKIYDSGHEVACHGYNHGLVTEKTEDQFVEELKTAKKIIENIINKKIYGYRAPCFSLTNTCLEKLSNIGFRYDSSYIQFSAHNLYTELDMSGFERIDSIILKKKGEEFYEFQIPTTKVRKFRLPFSGGGYLRIIPFFLFRLVFRFELKNRREYMLFLHPFELYPGVFQLPIKTTLKDRLRYSYGRRSNLNRLSKLLKIAESMDYEYTVMNPK